MNKNPNVNDFQCSLVALPDAAWMRFCALYERAKALDLKVPNAVCLATANADGQPTARIVLLKDSSAAGFSFYTNSLSRKGADLAVNAQAALCFFWDPLMEQVRVEGFVEALPADQADAYFSSRPRDAQIGAWASLQSQPLPSRTVLEQRVREYEAQYANAALPRPAHWRGYRLQPLRIEFWRSMPARLHQRDSFSLREGHWVHEQLYP